MPQDFLFDIGNVILKFDFSIVSDRLRTRISGAPENFLDPIEDMKMALESGGIDDNTFITEAIELLGFEGTRDEFARIWCEIFELNEPMADVIHELAANGNRLYLLSNTNGLHKDFFFGAYPIFACFRDGVYSYSSRSMKPGEEIYQAAFDTFKLKPEATVYLDDHEENIATGNRLGLRSILYDPSRHEAVIPALKAAGVAID